MFKFFKNNSDFDISIVNRDNANEYIKDGKLKIAYLISPDFGGSEDIDNQIVVTPKAFSEKQEIDDELYSFLKSGKSVAKFHCDLKYKNKSIVPSKIVITALIDGKPYNKIIKIW